LRGGKGHFAKIRESDDLSLIRHDFMAVLSAYGIETTVMLCDTCRWTERPGFVRRVPTAVSPVSAPLPAMGGDEAEFIPCPDCGGQGVAHCCEGLCERPEADAFR
jgi:hypothetical protein